MIALIIAMSDEAQQIIDNSNLKIVTNSKGPKHYLGKLNNKNIVLAISGIGKVNSAYATTFLLENYSIDQIINIGVAGNLNHNDTMGDIVLIEESSYSDVDVRDFGYKLGEIPQEDNIFITDKILNEKVMKSNENIKLRKCLTSDRFVNNKRMIKEYLQEFEDFSIVDMELTSILQVAKKYNIKATSIKIVSDSASELSKEEYEETMKVAKEKIYDIIINIEI